MQKLYALFLLIFIPLSASSAANDPATEAAAPRKDIVLQWNDILLDTIRADRMYPGPTWASRNAAIVHAAIYDAMRDTGKKYAPYAVTTDPPANYSPDAAAAAAAHQVLAGLYPDQRGKLDRLYSRSLAGIPNNPRKWAGVDYGICVGNEILELRSADGSADTVPYIPGTAPGDWRPTPPDFSPAVTPQWGYVRTFVIGDAGAFLPEPPPPLASAEYADSYNFVKEIGRIDSTTRNDEELLIGLFWAYDRRELGTPVAHYNQIAQTIALAKKNSTFENARLFALANLVMADAGIVAWRSKYLFDLWRPVTAIREGDTDGNPLTEADPGWLPYGVPYNEEPTTVTPPFPACVSGHSTFGFGFFRLLARFYGTDAFTFTATSDELPGYTRSFTSFSAAADENGFSRMYLGVHYPFDNTNAKPSGRRIADYVFMHVLRPL